MLTAEEVARVFEYLSLTMEGVLIDKTRLNALLYFAQGHTLAELNHEMFSNQIGAYEEGPVIISNESILTDPE